MQVEDHPNHQEALLGRAETQKVAPPVSSVRTASSSISLPLHGISRQATAVQASDNYSKNMVNTWYCGDPALHEGEIRFSLVRGPDSTKYSYTMNGSCC